ncbi:MAG: triose-phosphate isomerase [Parcubacteria group bacterium]|jgi:triosephosphate isomerase
MKFIVGNLKMNLISEIERENYFKSFESGLEGKKFKNVKLIICPPFIHLETFRKKIDLAKVSLGAQNIHQEASGRFTGEISAPMVKNFGGDYVIIGHSERRNYFNEDNEIINKKIKISLKNGLTPIICIGETANERINGEIKNVISKQLMEGLQDISKTKFSQIIIAYEPVWAIGSGKVPTSDEIMEARILMQKILADKFDLTFDKMPQIIYGGSVDTKDIKEVCINSGMNGVLVGGESLHVESFIKIAEFLENN